MAIIIEVLRFRRILWLQICASITFSSALRFGRGLARAFRRRMMRTVLFAVALSLFASAPSYEQVRPADLVLTNGRIVTIDSAMPEAQAIAISGDRIQALGTSADIRRYEGPSSKIIDLHGRLATPGLIDGHAHFLGVGEAQLNLNLMSTTSWDQIVSMVAEAVKKAAPGDWIVGRGWHQEKWTARPQPNVEGFPTHASLDAVSPNNPVVLTHASGHASFVNAKAMQLSGITRTTPNPSGGEILKDANGNPTGLLRETASTLVRRRSDDQTRARRALELASQEALSKGLTTIQDAGSSFATIDLMKEMIDEGKIGVRLWVMVSEPNQRAADQLAKYRTIDYGNKHLTVRAIKRYMDGALGSRGAWLLSPYSDKPDSVGLNTSPLQEIADAARLAIANAFQLCVHAIGDRANRETLNIFEEAFKANPGKRDLRWRIEHAQHLAAADIPRFGQLGVIASMQGIHATSDAPFVIERLGAERADEGAYVWQRLMKSGAVVSNGTDAPVEDIDPIPNYYATVTRKTKGGKAFYPEQRMSRMEALRSMTLNAAYAAFQDDSRGSLAVGKLADVTVLSKDITAVPEEEIPSARVAYTIVGGKILYEQR
jgi:predicted amidohydrolase YtcJ